MKILFDIGHPAHVHLFKCFAQEMKDEGHDILFTTRDKDLTLHLLQQYNLPYISLGKPGKGILRKLLMMFYFEFKLYKIVRQFKPDYLLSHGSIYAAHISFLLGKSHISFEDTGNMEQIVLYKPFTKAILVSDSFRKNFGKKTVIYPGYHELAYLHPNRFVPNKEVLRKYDLDPSHNMILVRFVSWNASHDLNHAGIPLSLKIKAIGIFSQYGKVLISSEDELSADLIPYQIKINPVDIFHVMAHCKVVFGESGTMASEAAVLGVPAIYIDSDSRDYTQEQEKKYGLVYNFKETEADIEQAIAKAEEILKAPDTKKIYENRRVKLLADKIDVTSFTKDFLINYDLSRNKFEIPTL